MSVGQADGRAGGRTLASSQSGAGRVAGPLLAAAFLALPATWVLPLFRTEFFYWFGNEVSIIGAVRVLADTDWLLCAILVVFGLAMPVLKLAAMLLAWFWLPRERAARWIGRAAKLSKLAMLDLLLVAISIVGFKGVGLGSVIVAPGLYAYAAVVLLVMSLGFWMERLAEAHARPTPGSAVAPRGQDPDVGGATRSPSTSTSTSL